MGVVESIRFLLEVNVFVEREMGGDRVKDMGMRRIVFKGGRVL